MRYVLLLLLAGCFHDTTAPRLPVSQSSGVDHTGDPCWYVLSKLPLKPPAPAGDTLYVWAHVAGCH